MLKALRSVKLALFLLVVIAVVLIGATVMKSQARAARYIYHSWWFVSLLGLFSLNLLLCTLARWSFTLKRLGTTMTHAGVLVMVIGVVVDAISGERGFMQLDIGDSGNVCYASSERYTWDGAFYDTAEEARKKKSDYESDNLQVQILQHGGKYLLYTRPARKFILPFTVHLQDFKVERYRELVVQVVDRRLVRAFPVKLGKTFAVHGTPYSLTVLRYEPDFVVLGEGVYGSRSGVPRNPAIQVRVENGSPNRTSWVFANFPGMHQERDSNVRLLLRMERIKAFKSRVQLLRDGAVVASKTIEVNKPLKHKGHTIYQSDYDQDREMYSVFEIARDPGVPFVYIGFVIISAGVAFTFYFRPLLAKRARRVTGAPTTAREP